MKAVILAAGRGSRLSLPTPAPKCLVEVGGQPIVEHQLSMLQAEGVRDVLVVVGYRGELVADHLKDRVRCRVFDAWDCTNNFVTLWSVRDELQDGFICLFSDVLCDDAVMGQLARSEADICLVVDSSRVRDGTMRVRLANDGVRGVGRHIPPSEGSGNFIGIARFSAAGARRLIRQMDAMLGESRNEYYTIAIDRLVQQGEPVGYVDVAGRSWVEIDTVEDLERARTLFGAVASR